MSPKPLLARIVIAASAVCAPLWGQTPLFTDGAAFGGSQVFSEGMNPLANPARYSQAPTGYYFSFLNGDQQSQNTETILNNIGPSDPASLAKLANAPWILRTQAYGVESIKSGACFGLTREEFNSVLAYPDLGGFGSSNVPYLDGRRATVDRLNLGGGGPMQTGSTTTLGVSLRIERWAMGETILDYFGTGNPFASYNSTLLQSTGTSVASWNLALDAGAVLELTQGIRLGLTADQLNPKHLWDVYLQPQFRAGLQIDLGTIAQLSLESDLNAVELMPFPVKQQSAGASLRFTLSPAAAFLVGVEQKKVDSIAVTMIGGSLQIKTQSLLLAFGFQAGQDRPMKGATVMFN
jgi:hypothetical protein